MFWVFRVFRKFEALLLYLSLFIYLFLQNSIPAINISHLSVIIHDMKIILSLLISAKILILVLPYTMQIYTLQNSKTWDHARGNNNSSLSCAQTPCLSHCKCSVMLPGNITQKVAMFIDSIKIDDDSYFHCNQQSVQ